MVDTEIRLIIFYAAKDAGVLYSQQKQDWEMTVLLEEGVCYDQCILLAKLY